MCVDINRLEAGLGPSASWQTGPHSHMGLRLHFQTVLEKV